MQPLTKPTRSEVDRDGRQFIVYTFKTALTAAKAGTLESRARSPPTFLMQIPQRAPAAPRSTAPSTIPFLTTPSA